jgi:hypothetical protein
MWRKGDEIHLTAEEAEGGEKRSPLQWVLAVSLFLAIVALTAVWVIGAFESQSPVNNASAPASESPRARGQ